MKRQTWLADEVEVVVSGVLKTHHVLQTASGPLGELISPAFKPGAAFRGVDGRELVVLRTSWWRGTYELRDGGSVVGSARPVGLFRRENSVQFRGGNYRLRAAGLWGRTWHLLDDVGAMVLEVRSRGVFRRGATLRILMPLEIGLLVFTYHLVCVRWQEQSGGAATD
jgi:hypothetical protein